MDRSAFMNWIDRTLQMNWFNALLIMLGAVILAVLLDLILSSILRRMTRRTESPADDHLLGLFHRPVYFSVILGGLQLALASFDLADKWMFISGGVIKTLIILIWSRVIWRAVSRLFHDPGLSRLDAGIKPLLENVSKFLVIALGSYFLFLAWQVNVSAWLASAGVIGIAVGLAAKDSLANLISGVFITADKPYKVGDYIVLDSGERGRVTQIGIRSTRILTWADVEIIIPNAIIANSKITNQSGGLDEKMATKVEVGVAYGSDVDRVRELLYEIARGSEVVCTEPGPIVRFGALGDSALLFKLMFWVTEPVRVAAAEDDVITKIYKTFAAEGIEIPFPQRTVHHVGQESDPQES